MKKLFIAEKPSQMRSIKEAFEPSAKKYNGYYEGEKYIFTNAIGHLFEIMKSDEKWEEKNLPIILKNNIIENYQTKDNLKDQVNIIYKLLSRNDIEEIICATDPDAEGESIYREIVEMFEYDNDCRVKDLTIQTRLIIKDTTPSGLKEQFQVRKSIEDYEGLRQRAFGRAIADYTIGINLTQALTLKSGILFTVGRVQTPTLKLICKRYLENKNHVKNIEYGFNILTNNENIILMSKKHKFKTKEEAEKFEVRAKEINNTVKNIKKHPPKLHDLASIQKWANNVLNLTADQTLGVLQNLYEKGYITYPRTDCKFVTEETANRLNNYYGSKEVEGIKLNSNINSQCVGKVSAHEGLTLSEKEPKENELNENENKIYNQIKNVFISNYLDSIEAKETEYYVEIKDNEEIFKYSMKNYEIIEKGYLNFYDDKPYSNLYEINEGINYKAKEVKEIESKPKPLFTEATLLSKMQNIHNDEDFEVEEETKELSKEIEGIGTPATRGSIIKGLFDRKYVELKGKSIIPTETGINLLKTLRSVKSPLLNLNYTAKLEKQLQGVEQTLNLNEFVEEINNFTRTNVDIILKSEIKKVEKVQDILGKCPKCKNNIIKIKTKTNKDMYICKSKECDFTIPVYCNLNDSDVKKVLEGKRSGVKKKKSKEGKEYKVKYYLEKTEVKQEFVNK